MKEAYDSHTAHTAILDKGEKSHINYTAAISINCTTYHPHIIL